LPKKNIQILLPRLELPFIYGGGYTIQINIEFLKKERGSQMNDFLFL
jgi:hypothetical protein